MSLAPASELLAPVPLSAPAAPLEVLDDAQEWEDFSRPWGQNPALCESYVVVQGMHCAACALNVEEALRQVPGVRGAQVGAASQRARVLWDPAQTLPSRWMRAPQARGYQLLPAHDAFSLERRSRQTRRALWHWMVAALCMMQVMMYAYPAYIASGGELSAEMERLLRWASWVIALPVMVFASSDFFRNAWRDLRARRISMDLPVALGIGITFAVSTAGTFDPQGSFGREVFFDSLTMFVFFLLGGRLLELRLRDRTAGALEAVLNRMPQTVQRRTAQGQWEQVAARRVQVGDQVRIVVGEAFVADGVVEEGRTTVDEALLTGESSAVLRGVGDAVIAGSHNLGAPVTVRVTQTGADTRYAQIVALMESASTSRPAQVRRVDRLATPFLWFVLLCALAAALYWWPLDPAHAVMVAVAVLIVTCPCALSLATPAALLAAAGALARQGTLVRQLQALETLAKADTVVFDKTGTLTDGHPALQAVRLREGASADQALAVAAVLAQHSLHPLSRALVQAARERGLWQGAVSAWHCDAVQEQPGQGLGARLRGAAGAAQPAQAGVVQGDVRLGSARWCGLSEAAVDADARVHLSDARGWLASFVLQELPRQGAQETVAALQRAGLAVHILSGDAPARVQEWAERLGVAQAQGGCTPQDKLARLRALQQQGAVVVMVGDGVNDAPVLSGAQVAMALGQGAAVLRTSADLVLMGADLRAVAHALALAQRTRRVITQNLWWAFLYNAACVPLAVLGWLPAWGAGLGMAASSLLVVANAQRLSRVPAPLRAPGVFGTAAA
ncbi:MAG: heavy metal translocating P-type ATPase [Rhodoferax sp.]